MRIVMKKVISSKYLPYVIYGGIVLALHMIFFIHHGDDIRAILALGRSTGYADWTFKDENSRFVINYITYYILKMGDVLYIVIDVLMYVVLFAALHHIAVKEKTLHSRYIAMLSMLLYPIYLSVSVGWIMTPIAYVWTASFAAVACVPLRDFMDGRETVRLFWYPASAALLIFAANKEDLAVLLFIIFVCFFAESVKEKRMRILLGMDTLICLISVVYGLLASNNSSRMELTTKKMKLIEYFDIGFTGTLQEMIFDYDFVFFVMLLLLAINVIKKHPCIKGVNRYAIVAVVPLLMWIYFGLYLGMYRGDIKGEYSYDMLLDNKTVLTGKYDSVDSVFFELMVFLVWLLLFVNIFIAFEDKRKSIIILLLLVAGICERTTVGFAGNSQFDYERTFAFLYNVFIVIIMVIVLDLWEKCGPQGRQRVIEVLLIAAICVIMSDVYNLSKYFRLTEMGLFDYLE